MEQTSPTTASAATKPAHVLVGPKEDAFPLPDQLWELFSKKGTKTIFLSLGTSPSCLADLDIAEQLGCPLHAFPVTETELAAWEETREVLIRRARDASGARFPFSAGAEEKWILKKNLIVQRAVPWIGCLGEQVATLEGATTPLPLKPAEPLITGLCSALKLESARVDILKLDYAGSLPGLEREALRAVLEAGFRPGLVLVRWEGSPDAHVPSCYAAGHLQMMGYKLIAVHEGKYLYYFTDQDLYMSCSWLVTTVPNPLAHELLIAGRASALATPPVAGEPAPLSSS